MIEESPLFLDFSKYIYISIDGEHIKDYYLKYKVHEKYIFISKNIFWRKGGKIVEEEKTQRICRVHSRN